jgi:hypothetical protein
MTALLFVLLLFLLVLSAFMYLVLRALRCGETATVDREWLEEFSTAKYRPMERLLSEDDFRFLASQPGFDRGVARRLRAERRRIFQVYLSALQKDFNRLHSTARLIVLYSPQDRSDLAAVLFQVRVRFYVAYAKVWCKLLLHTWGFGTVEIGQLVGALDTLQQQLLGASAA